MLTLILFLLPALAGPPTLARGPPERRPRFFDTGDPARLTEALESQADWYARQPRNRAWPLGEGTVTAARLRATCLALLEIVRAEQNPALALRDRFELYFATGAGDTGRAVFTGYYNPVIEARLAPDPVFRYPLYRPPPQPRHDRRAIEELDALDGKGLEIAWLNDPFDRYYVHVEGSATLLLPDGSTVNVHYAGNNGHAYNSLAGELIRAGLVEPESLTVDAVRAALARRPEGYQPWFNRNPRYIYFRLGPEPPGGATGIPLVPGRSVATDHAVFPPGIPCWAAVRLPLPASPEAPGSDRAWASFVLNHDVGAAIRGPERVDIYWGEGDRAADLAGRFYRPGRFYVLVLREP